MAANWVTFDSPEYQNAGSYTGESQLYNNPYDGPLGSAYSLPDSFWNQQGYQGNIWDQELGRSTPEFSSWVQENGYQPAALQDKYGVNVRLNKNGQPVAGSNQYIQNADPYFDLATSLAMSLINPTQMGANLGSIFELGKTGSAMLGGGLLGAQMAGLNGGDPLTGAITGGLGTQMPNVASMAGINNEALQGAVNGAVKGGISSAVQGGDAGKGAFMGGIPGLGNSLMGIFGSTPEAGPFATAYGNEAGSNYAAMGGDGTAAQIVGADTSPIPEYTAGGEATPTMREMLKSIFNDGVSNPFGGKNVKLGDLAGGLMGLYQSLEARKRAKSMYNNLSNMYGPNSAYAQQLEKTLTRADAAAGRRSQYGNRAVELQARLADANSRNAPTLANLSSGIDSSTLSMFNSLLNLGSLFGLQTGRPQSNLTVPQASYSPSNMSFNAAQQPVDYSLGTSYQDWLKTLGNRPRLGG